MTARFFVDENDLALGKRLAEDHDGVVYPGHPDLPEVPRGSLDDDWLPIIGAQGLVVIPVTSESGTAPSRSGCGSSTTFAASC